MAPSVADPPPGCNTADPTCAPAQVCRPGDVGATQLAALLAREAPGLQAGLCTAAARLVARHLRFDAADPHWQGRDRVVAEPALSGLAAALAHLTGVTGSDGPDGAAGLLELASPALGCGVGMALAERILAARFGRSLIDHRTWVLCGAAALADGQAWEAARLAGMWRLGRLTVLAAAQDGILSGAGWEGWAIRHAGDPAAVRAALSAALRSLKPTLVLCGDQADGPAEPPADADAARAGWRMAGARLAGVRRTWLRRLARHAAHADFAAACAGRLPPRWHAGLSDPPPRPPGPSSPAEAVRTSWAALQTATGNLALLPGHAGWRQPAGQTEPPPAGRPGLLAAGMGAALCGAALHGGLMAANVQPESALPALLPGLRLAAARGSPLLAVLVEDGGGAWTMLRALPGIFVLRPADATEALECLELALRRQDGPTVLVLSEAAQPLLSDRPSRTRAFRGGYVAAEAPAARAATLLASGPELHVALTVRALLARAGIAVAVAALPCWALFARQEPGWQAHVLGAAPRWALEPGSGFGWAGWLGQDGQVLEPTDPADIALRLARHLRAGRTNWTRGAQI